MTVEGDMFSTILELWWLWDAQLQQARAQFPEWTCSVKTVEELERCEKGGCWGSAYLYHDDGGCVDFNGRLQPE